MYDTETDRIMDATFGAIAARAARYPVIEKRSQPRPVLRESPRAQQAGDPGIRWLLLNTQRTNRVMEGTA